MFTPKLSILLVDDDIDDRQMLKEALTDLLPDFSVILASNGNECMNLLKNGCQPDLVFIDLNMPMKNGLECLRDIDNKKLLPATPVIIYSASHQLKDITAASNYGARFYLVKPSDYKILVQVLQRVLYLLGRPITEQTLRENFVLAHNKMTVA